MQTIGERLEEARKKKGISVREAAEATKIRGDYLQKFESNQFDIGLSPLYVRGFLRSYSHFLKLPEERILGDFEAVGANEEARPRQPARELYGRMDLSVATRDDRSESPASAESPSAPAAPEQESGRSQPRVPRSRNALPTEPVIDPALLYKGLIAIGALVVVILVIFAIRWASNSGSGSSRSAAPVATLQSAPDTSTLTLTAAAPIQYLKVVAKSDGRELYNGALNPGDKQDIPNVPVILSSDSLESLRITKGGRTLQLSRVAGRRELQVDLSK
jgi:transcriptional regulator with XRE-family HTH domain